MVHGCIWYKTVLVGLGCTWSVEGGISSYLVLLGQYKAVLGPYLIFVIFFTRAKFLENRIYTEKRQFFALNL